MKHLITLIFMLASFPMFAAELYCGGQKIDMNLVSAEYSGTVFEDYLPSLDANNCGVEGATCFVGKDSTAYKLLNLLNFAIYQNNYEVRIVGSYFATGNPNTISLKYVEQGYYKETTIYHCM